MKQKLLFIFLSLIIIGCSSGSDSQSSYQGVPTKLISGKVSDPAVKNAKVMLVDSAGEVASFCGGNGTSLCQTWTDNNGVFSIFVALNQDVTSYHLVTKGGIDTAYGKNFDTTPFSILPLNTYVADVNGGYSNILITPVTSLLKSLVDLGLSENDALALLETSLGVAQADLKKDPERVDSLLKAAYLVTKIALSKAGANPFTDIANSINANKTNITSDAVLQSIFSTDLAKIEEIKTSATTISNATGSGKDLISQISNSEYINLFMKSFATILNTTSANLSENAKTNISNLAAKVKNYLQDTQIPLQDFTIDKITSYISSIKNSSGSQVLNLVDTFNQDSATFNTNVDSILAATSEIYSKLDSLVKEEAVSVFVGLPTAIGSDNQKRLEYYFNSTANVNYLARTIISKISNDNVNDKIYVNIVRSYARYNLFEQAKIFADVYIRDSLQRANAYAAMASGLVQVGNKAKALEFAENAYNQLEVLRKNSFTFNDTGVSIYISVASIFAVNGNSDKFTEIKNLVLNELVAKALNAKTLHGQLNSAFGSPYYSGGCLIDNSMHNDRNVVLNLMDSYEESIESYYNTYYNDPASIRDTMNTAANAAVMNYGFLTKHYSSLLELHPDLSSHIKDKVSAIYDKVLDLVNKEESVYTSGTAIYFRNQLKDIIVVMYVMLDKSKANVLFEKLGTDEDGINAKANVTAQILYALVKTDGFEKGIQTYEELNPMKDDFSNVTGVYGVLYSLVGSGVLKGVAAKAFDEGNYTLARSALDYAYAKLQEAANYQTTLQERSLVTYIASSYSSTTGYYSGYASKHTKFGYILIADYYNKIGDNEKAKEVLNAAKTYADGATNNFVKFIAYGSIANMAKEIGYMDLYNTCYTLSKDFVLVSSDISNASNVSMNIFKAYDMYYFKESNYVAEATKLISEATQKLTDLYNTSTTKDHTNTITQYIYMAKIYDRLNNSGKVKEVLQLAEVPLNAITVSRTKLTYTKDIVNTYAECLLVDEAYNKTETLLTEIADKHSAIETIASTLSNYMPYGVENYMAISDLDKDGKVDFIAPWVTEKQIKDYDIIIDDDIDNDGELDTVDLTPFYAD